VELSVGVLQVALLFRPDVKFPRSEGINPKIEGVYIDPSQMVGVGVA